MLSLKQIFSRNPAKEKFSIGLDIGSSEIKLVKLELGEVKPLLLDFFVQPIEGDLSKSLKNISLRNNIGRVNISVSGPSAIIRYIFLPRMSEEELKQAVLFEAGKHIPFPISEVNVDAHILKSDLADNKMLVLIAAVKKAFLRERLKLLEEAGLKVKSALIDSIALVNAFNFNYPEMDKLKAAALLNIGASFSNLNILEGASPRLSRDFHIAGNSFTQKISDILGVSAKEAEVLKISPDKEMAEKASSAIDLALSQLAVETRISFDYYESQNASSLAKIFLSGGSSLQAGLKDNLAAALGIEADYWDPLKQLLPAADLDVITLKKISPKLAVAVGLALS